MKISYDELKDLREERDQLAKDVLEIAMAGGMPESFWFTDSRIKRACKVLDYSPAQAYVWAQHPGEL